MNISHLLFYKIFISIFLFLFIAACSEYDVASPQWDQNFEDVPEPIINLVSPANGAVAGVNTITITGENFLEVPDSFGVYFNTVPTEVISSSTTSLTVRRPNLVADSATIKVVPSQTLKVAYFSPYKIDAVLENFTTFDANVYSSCIAVDQNENIYVINTPAPYDIIKINSSGEKNMVGTCSYIPSRIIIGPDGRLYITRTSNREILVFDEDSTATETSRWTRLPRGILVSYGIFDSEGYFYAGGNAGGLVSVPPNPDIDDPTINETGYYENDDILGLTIYQNYIYVAVLIATPDVQHPELAIWRHSLNGSGTLGDMELIVDLSSYVTSSISTITTLLFDIQGNMFIGTDAGNPILINTSGTSDVDYFYKNILPSNCRQFCWGSSNHIYMIVDEQSETTGDGIYRVDMGALKGN